MLSWYQQRKSSTGGMLLLGLLLLLALLWRLIIAPIWIGYDTDVKTFLAWSDRAYTVGLSQLYTDAKSYFLDYPPGYMYVLYVIGMLHHKLSIPWESASSLMILKMPAILADVVTAYVIYRLALQAKDERDRTWTWLQAFGMAALFVFDPAIWANSAVWGQVDSFFMLFILATLHKQQQGKLPQASVFMALAILLKPQALLFGIFLLIDVIRRRNVMTFVLSVLSGAASIVILALPFSLGRGYSWLIDLYAGTLSSYPYASLNAFNLMALLGGNFIDINTSFMHISYQTLGSVLMALAIVYTCWLYIRSKGRTGGLFYVAFLFITAVFMVMAKMHERYLHYGLLLALASFIYLKDRRILWLFIGFSFTHFINVADVLLRSFHQDYHIPRYDALMLVISAANVVMLGYACLLGWRLFVNQQQDGEQQEKREEQVVDVAAAPEPAENRLQHTFSKKWDTIFKVPADEIERSGKGRFFTKKDAWYLGGLVVIYTIIALFHLGGHKDPVTFWKPEKSGESVIVDLGAPHNLTRINSFAGVGEGAYSYWFSMDGQSWKDQMPVKSDHTKVFTWTTVEPKMEARYVKIAIDSQESAALHLHEIGFFGDGSPTIIPIAQVMGQEVSGADEGNPALLFDETDTVPYTPTYMDGSYFDEIYHARTAYEHLHQIEPYESTHPPLGKILISLGIYVFGLNPFGWRIVGTLFGVGMIPVMYVFAKRMFGCSEYAFIAAFLLTFDFMHFAQTRIATIDVYGVFFIMVMFYFMYRYTTLSFYQERLWTTLVPLGLSGLFFGIGAASKWIVIYGGAGLALLLLLTLLERYGEYRFARRLLSGRIRKPDADNEEAELSETERSRLQAVAQSFVRNTLLTLAWCVLTFVLIPVIVYVLSYIPFMMVPGPGHGLKDLWAYQVHMYNYHKNLVATHPFSSPWWEWPLMLRPIWYYQAKLMPPGVVSSIISFGNPLVWWPGFVSVLVSFYLVFKRNDKKLRLLLIAYCSQYLPWILVPRLTFIYHYFAMVPFLVLMLAYYIREFMQEKPEALGRRNLIYGYMGAVVLLFILFYPILSGMMVPAAYTFLLRWLPGWNFF